MATKKTSKKIVTKSVAAKKKTKNSTRVAVFARTTNKSQEWIKEMHQDLKWMSGDNIYHLLRAVLHALREQLSVSEAAHFSAQLPLLLRGTFYEGWDPKLNLKNGANKDAFLQLVQNKMSPAGMPKFEIEKGVLIALNIIKKHISAGEIKDIVGSLNSSLKVFIQKTEPSQEASL